MKIECLSESLTGTAGAGGVNGASGAGAAMIAASQRQPDVVLEPQDGWADAPHGYPALVNAATMQGSARPTNGTLTPRGRTGSSVVTIGADTTS
jgi:hypothetical protein